MSAIVCVVRPEGELDHATVAERLGEMGDARDVARPLPPPRLSLVPYARTPAAIVVGAAPEPTDGLVVHRYRVETSTPIAGDVGGIGVVTLFRRKPGLDLETFRRSWHEGHSPLAMRVHPLNRYVRHVVEESLEDAPPLDGIVIEQVRERADLTRPWRFFGGDGLWLVGAVRIGLDVRRWLDLSTIENQLVRYDDKP